jgi:FdhD protein
MNPQPWARRQCDPLRCSLWRRRNQLGTHQLPRSRSRCPGSLQQMVRPVTPVAAGGSLSAPALDADVAQLSSRQTLHLATGAAHAVAFVRWSGEVLLLREDVGRHNALDKLIGAMARARVDSDAGFELVTSRANYEMVHKTATAGITLLAAMSAPPAMAARIATQTGITLVGFAGRTRRLVRAHSQRVQPASR